MYASFGHLTGYSSNYYTYAFDKVIALDFFAQFDPDDLLGGDAGARYRKTVLEQGGSKPGREMVRDFLGRDEEFAAFSKLAHRRIRGRTAGAPHVAMNAPTFAASLSALKALRKARTWARPIFAWAARIFATLAARSQGYGNSMLTPGAAGGVCRGGSRGIFLPIAGGWGRNGATHVRLAAANEDVLTRRIAHRHGSCASKRTRKL